MSSFKSYTDHPLWRFYTFLATLPAYFSLIVWPVDLHMLRDFLLYDVVCPPVLIGAGMMAAATAQTIYSSIKPNRGIEMSWGLLWFAAAYAPNSGILAPMDTLFHESWIYLPLVGLFLGLAETVVKLLHNHSRISFACATAALVIAGLMSVKTYSQNAVWHDPVSFYGNILRYNKTSAQAHSNLGMYYADIGDYNDAIDQFKQAIEIADNQPVARYNLAMAYLNMPGSANHIPDAIANLQRSLELDPNYNSLNSYRLLSTLYDRLNNQEKARYYRDRADAIDLQQK